VELIAAVDPDLLGDDIFVDQSDQVWRVDRVGVSVRELGSPRVDAGGTDVVFLFATKQADV